METALDHLLQKPFQEQKLLKSLFSEERKRLSHPQIDHFSPRLGPSLYARDFGQKVVFNQDFRQVESIGPIDVQVSNSGYLPSKPFGRRFGLERLVDYLRCRRQSSAIRHTRAADECPQGAVLINMSSGLDYQPTLTGFSSYATSEFASIEFFEYARFEEPSLHVFNLHPSVIATDLSEGLGYGHS